MKPLHIYATLVAVLFLGIPGWTTTVVRMDLQALVQESDSIVQGRIERVDAQWDDQKKTIFTYIFIRVHDPLKGEFRPNVLIRQLGGKVGDMNLSIIGMPVFRSGEEVIVFLKSNPTEATYHVVGLTQGKYEVKTDFAVANALGIELLDRKTGQIEGGAFTREPLETFKSRIRSMVK
jgi:hypothetical protein